MVCETQNLLTLQYTVYSKIPFSKNSYHAETNHLQCIANQLNGFNRDSKFSPTRVGLLRVFLGSLDSLRKILNTVGLELKD